MTRRIPLRYPHPSGGARVAGVSRGLVPLFITYHEGRLLRLHCIDEWSRLIMLCLGGASSLRLKLYAHNQSVRRPREIMPKPMISLRMSSGNVPPPRACLARVATIPT